MLAQAFGRSAGILIRGAEDIVAWLCEHVHVLDFGRTIAAGPPAEVQRDPVVIQA